jgi:iron(III) transport system substrate-binding protein
MTKSHDARGGLGRRTFLKGAGLVAVGGFAGVLSARQALAQGGAASEQALAAAAKKEGSAVLYTSSEESIVSGLAKGFSAKYGVTLEYQRLNSAVVATRYSSEAQAGKTAADLLLTGDPLLIRDFAAKGWMAKFNPAEIPGLSAWPADFKDDHSATVTINPQTFAINTDKVKTAPAKWEGMLDPKLKGQIVTVDLKRVGLVAFFAYDLMLRLYGEDFLKKLGQQGLKLADSGPSAVQQLASGAVSGYFPCSTTQANSMISQGAPVKAILPPGEPYTGVLSPIAVSAKAPHPNAARLFAGYLLTPEAQAILNKETVSPVSAPGTAPLPPGFVKPDYASTEANQKKIIQLLAI